MITHVRIFCIEKNDNKKMITAKVASWGEIGENRARAWNGKVIA